jgi:hypothetical protein
MIGRRAFLGRVLGGGTLAAAGETRVRAQEPTAKGKGAEPLSEELDAVRARLESARIGPLHTARTTHYEAIGDAAEGFIRVILGDCEQLAADYLAHFRACAFEVQMPERRLVVVMFRDDRSFGRFLKLRAPAGVPPGAAVLQPTGAYDRKTNVLQVFDWRNVPMSPRSAARNSETLAHEGTHQLCFNTGLLRRDGDVPLCIVEGLGTFGEARRPVETGGFGRRNLRRLEDLARLRRQTPWIPLAELITDDEVLRSGRAVRVLLAYAQSWLLVHYLMKTPSELPRFRSYIKAVSTRRSREQRLEDAKAHLGDLDGLDQRLRRYSVRLLTTV